MQVKNKYLYIFLALFLFVFTSDLIFAQCGCMSSISVGTLSPNLGSSSTGTIRQGFLSFNLSGNYVTGDHYRSGWEEIPPVTVKEFENTSGFLQLSYGITNRLSTDVEFGYTFGNYINAPPFKYERSGPNFVNILGKYNLFYKPKNDFEITFGAGVKTPLLMVNDTNYKYTQSSQGAFAGIYQIFIHKGYKESGLHLFLIHRGELSVRNNADYLYGPYLATSLVASKAYLKGIIALIELKNELKSQDKNLDEVNFDSGFMNLSIAPQVIFTFGDFYYGTKFDLPIIRYYNGSQAAKNYSVSINIGYSTRLF